MSLEAFLTKLKQNPAGMTFEESMGVIDDNYHFRPVRFNNGSVLNQAGENNGSCKIFSFGLLHELSEEQTLACFGDYYRQDVLKHPENDDHQNIREFMSNGWGGIVFEGEALVPST